jgi:hypothetical protein
MPRSRDDYRNHKLRNCSSSHKPEILTFFPLKTCMTANAKSGVLEKDSPAGRSAFAARISSPGSDLEGISLTPHL